jgi:NTP pyrophosphatase (non-canonical NTP hydrolase)
MNEFKQIVEKIIAFRDARDWKQFHDSKNLATAISIEAAELNELFLWKNLPDSENINKEKLQEELADVLIYSILLAEKHEINIFDAILEKIDKNSSKYPIHKAKGNAKKYNEL